VLLCDEPTGALDRTTGVEVLELLRAAVTDLGRTVIVVSHDPDTVRFADRSLHLVDGRIVDDTLPGAEGAGGHDVDVHLAAEPAASRPSS